MDTDTTEALALLPRPTDFVQVPVELIRRIGANAAILLSRMHWRFEGGWRLLHEHDGQHWWEATMADLADETGLTVKQVRGALDALVAMDAVVREKHRLAGDADHSYSYRVRTVEEARALLPTDLPQRANQLPTDLPQRADRFALEGKSASIETSLNSLNADAVGEDEEEVDKSGPFHVTPAREKLVTDAMTDSGQAGSVAAYVAFLRTVDWDTGVSLIRRWCGVQAAVRNGERASRRSDIDELLVAAGLPPVSDDAWWALLSAIDVVTGIDSNCRFNDSGYCDQHGLRLEDHG